MALTPVQGRRPIVFVHGGCHGSWSWVHFPPYFAQAGWDCHALNWFGHNGSAPHPEVGLLQRGIADVTEEIAHVAGQFEESPVIVAHSMGATKALGASGVTVNTVSPGMILTPKLEEVFRQMATTNGWVASDASWEEIERAFLKVSQVPLGRIGRVDEVAHAVVFLCSPLASYITGADLRIDGGVVPAL